MGESLQKRIHSLIRSTLDAGPGAWLVWCDPRGEWLPLLRRVADDGRMGKLPLVEVTEWTAGQVGGLVTRRDLQQRLDAGESFVLYVPAAANALGWVWGQALLAERIYDRSLRSQLMEWGWRPHSPTLSDEDVAAEARQKLQHDPAQWGSDGLQPDLDGLLDLLAGLSEPDDEERAVLDLTIDLAGLPALDPADLPGWRRRCLAWLLATHAHQTAPDQVGEDHAWVVPADRRGLAVRLLERWVDSHRLMQRLPGLIDDADAMAGLAAALADADAAYGPFVSRAAEAAVFASTCRRLAQLEGRALLEALAALSGDIARHAQGLWGHRIAGSVYAIPWGELGRLSAAAAELIDATPAGTWSSPQAAVDWFVAGGWRMDRAGEEIERSLEASVSELTDLITPLRRAFRARWEETLLQWSQVWEQAGCPPLAELDSAGAWLKAQMAASDAPTAILTLDALRYALGASLVERLNHQEGVERGRVTAAHAPLPSITALGMGMALPLDEDQLEAHLGEKGWQLCHKGEPQNLSSADQRRKWWAAQPKTVVLSGLAALIDNDFPAPGRDVRRLVVYDASIDRQGHDDELAFAGSGKALDRYLAAVERLRDRGWRRILIVTDHGFIQWSGTQEHHALFPVDKPAYASRRAAAYRASTRMEGPNAPAPGGQWRVAVPRGAACFRSYGGLGYFHGGASLQEWIIPCVVIEWPQDAQPVSVQIEAQPRILSLRPKVVVNIVAGSLLRENSLSRPVEVIIRAAESQAILFRADPIQVSAEDAQVTFTLDAVEGAVASRGTKLHIQARDPRTELPLDTVDSVLLVELSGW